MKIYITRPDAERKYHIRYVRLIKYEQQGILTAYDVDEIDYPRKTNRSGAPIKWVYEEDQVAALARKIHPDASLAKRTRKEAEAVDLLDKGVEVLDIVKRLKISLAKAQQIREIYLREKGAVVIHPETVRAIRAMGFSFRPDNADKTIMALIEEIRAANARLGRAGKPPPAHVRYIPEDES